MVYTKRQSYLHLLVIVLLILTSFAISQPTAQAANITVNTTLDLFGTPPDTGGCGTDPNHSDKCSLRQAINQANANPGSTIRFAINKDDPGFDGEDTKETWTITLNEGNPLPAISQSTAIEGLSQRDFIGGDPNESGPEIIIDGQNVSESGGIILGTGSDGSTVQSLGFVNFRGAETGGLLGVGIEIFGDNNIVQGNYIGTRGFGPAENNDFGIWIRESSSGNFIGMDDDENSSPFDANVISGNLKDGILIEGRGNFIRGNFIGTDASGLSAVPNSGSGIHIRGIGGGGTATGNVIGVDPDSLDPGELQRRYRNVISGNQEFGIFINNASENGVYGNRIGLDQPATSIISNTLGGVRIVGLTYAASNNQIGGANQYTRNFIAGNGGPGISISGYKANENTITNNFIGIGLNYDTPTGSTSNNTIGIRIDGGASNNVIGGEFSSASEPEWTRNVISGNNGDGIHIEGSLTQSSIQSNSNTISGNFIGTNIYGAGSIPNQGDGVQINNNSQSNVIGGVTPETRNLIGNNLGYGIAITGTAFVYNPPDDVSDVSKNEIRSNNIFSNTLDGVFIEYAQDTIIQGEEDATLNITINGQNGIRLFNGFNTAISNFSILDNDQSGITVTGSVTTTIRSGEVMTHTLDGIVLIASDVNSIQSVQIESNQGNGITATGTTTTTIQSSTVLSNSLDGIATNNSNVTAINRTTVQWNDGDGVQVSSDAFPYSRDVYITQNTLSRNGGYGVRANKTTPGIVERVRITSNSISRNTAGGIDLDPATDQPGVSANPNHDIDPPITNLSSPLRLRVNEQGLLTGYVYTSTDKVNINPPGACVTCTIQIFRTDPTLTTPDGQGYELIGEATADEVGRFQDQINLTNGSLPPQILLTATDGYGNTSEFTAFTRSYGLEIVAEDPDPPEQDAAPGQTVTYTFRLTNTGTVDLTDLNLSADSSLDWTYALSPTTTFELPAADAMIVTMTLTLPTGSAENVRAGVQDQTRVTASSASIVTATDSITATTTVLEKFVLSVDPLSRSGRGAPEYQLTYVHKITNTGNVAGTVEITGTTRADGLAVPDPDWNPNTIIAPTTMTLGPGESTDLLVQVTIPDDSAEGISRVTRVELTVPSTPSENKVISDTTTVDLELLASMVQNEQGDAAAGEQISFEHVVTNLSNGTAPFRLNASSSLGSTISFRSNTSGINLTDTDTFSVSNVLGDNTFNFYIDITVNLSALKGEEDQVTVFLTDVEGNVIGGASVTDRINVTRSAVAPRLWLPLVFR